VNAATWDGRCSAAHVADPRPCEGPKTAVQIVDQTDAAVSACVLHGAVLLASLERGRVYPLNGPDGSAITVFTRAQTLPAFDFLTGPGVARVTTVNEAAVFPSAPEVTHWDGGVSSTDGAKDGCADAEQDDAGTIAALADESRETSDSRSTPTDSPSRSSCSGPGNARSSCWSETSTTRARGNA
jgi:hypothetical protein